jgi:single-strand DNA-binding protein
MPLPTLNGTARLVADPDLRVTPNGNAVCSMRLVSSNRKKDDAGNWVDGDQLWIDATAWHQLAEHCAESLTKGMEVVFSGELRTQSWEKDGQKHNKTELTVRSIGPSLAWATAQIRKADRTQQQPTGQRQQPQQHRQQPQNDPWASNQQQPAQNAGWGTQEPPF